MAAQNNSPRPIRSQQCHGLALPFLTLASLSLALAIASGNGALHMGEAVRVASPTSAAASISLSDQAAETQQVRAPQQTAPTIATRSSQRSSPLAVSPKSPLNSRQFGDTINDISIECNSDNIVVTLTTSQGFNGMIYPKGLSKNSSCMMEYHQLSSNITYYLPLKSCNTMSTDVEDGVEYFNTVMVQPHRRLVTNQGRGYHIRCRYQTKERTITNQEQQLSVNLTQSTPAVLGAASMPSCTMRIYSAHDLSHEVAAENVKIGDELHLVISLEEQDVYGMLVTNCLVRDGMNWGEQPLIDEHGCPVDEDIMPEFQYAHNFTRASVSFQAHKFPYTSSVYYQCNVRLCFREAGCQMVPPQCGNLRAKSQAPSGSGSSIARDSHYNNLAGNDIASGPAQANQHQHQQHRRHRRWLNAGELEASAPIEELTARSPLSPSGDMSFELISGLNVDETPELEAAPAAPPTAAQTSETRPAEADDEPLMLASTNDDPQESRTAAQAARDKQSEKEFCLSLRKFAIIISLISLLLMTLIITMIACMIQRRNKRRLEQQMHHSPYHHDPYTNQAYCRQH